MAVIRVPQEALALLPLCRKHERGPAEPAAPPCFETYADLIVFAASCGFADMHGKAPVRKTKFLDRPNPIDLAIFKSDRRYPQILLISLAASKDQNVVRDEDTMCRLVEDFAGVGCARIARSLNGAPGLSSHLAVAGLLTSALEREEDQKI